MKYLILSLFIVLSVYSSIIANGYAIDGSTFYRTGEIYPIKKNDISVKNEKINLTI